MTSFNIELNNKPEQGSNEHALLLRITEDRKHARIRLIYSIKPVYFNPKAKNSNFIRSTHPKHRTINQYLADKIDEAKEAYKSLEKDKKVISAHAIKELIQSPRSESFSAYMYNHLESVKRKNGIGNYKKYYSVYNMLKKFYSKNEIFFHEIDTKFLAEVEEHLIKEGKAQTTIAGYFRKIRATINFAIDDGTVKGMINPFNSFRIKNGKVNKQRLTQENIEKIESLVLPEGKLIWHVRNAFLFSFYAAGMRIRDVLLLKWENVKNDRLKYIMNKTNKYHSLKLPDQAIQILKNYLNISENEFIFPFMNTRLNLKDPEILYDQLSSKTALLNKYLKIIAEKAEINIKITTHTARHTFADLARKKIDNLYNLSKTLGHSSLTVTQNYLASFDEKAVDDTMDEIFK